MTYKNIDTYIGYIPKDKLMFELWKFARKSPYHYYLPNIADPKVTLDEIRNDINFMIENNREIDITTYHGKLLFINITTDTVDTKQYNMYNGTRAAENIIRKLKLEELEKSILNYYKFF